MHVPHLLQPHLSLVGISFQDPLGQPNHSQPQASLEKGNVLRLDPIGIIVGSRARVALITCGGVSSVSSCA